jgi:hypothetical protein
MRNVEKRLTDHVWIHEYRRLKQRKAEHDASICGTKSREAKVEFDGARRVLNEAMEECLSRAEAGEQLDIILAQLWRAELQRCERQEIETEKKLNIAEAEVEAANEVWRKSLMIADEAETEMLAIRRKWELAKDQNQLVELEELNGRKARFL